MCLLGDGILMCHLQGGAGVPGLRIRVEPVPVAATSAIHTAQRVLSGFQVQPNVLFALHRLPCLHSHADIARVHLLCNASVHDMCACMQ